MTFRARSNAAAAVLCATLAAGCARERPEPPAILRDVALIDDAVRFTHPYLPGHRTTMDGRVALRVQGAPEGPPRLRFNLSFYLFAPEKLAAPFMAGPPGAGILADGPVDVFFPPSRRPEATLTGHHAICDPTPLVPGPGERANPYACGPGLARDCYDFTVVSSTRVPAGARLWGTPVHVEVENPKTPSARLAEVSLGEPVAGTLLEGAPEWTEPAVTRDGRLLTGRRSLTFMSWTNPETGETLQRGYDIMYAMLPDEAAPCDVTGWTEFHPMSHAPYDPRVAPRYGFAAHPFRDAEGVPIPDGEDLAGNYPWLDREGVNLFMGAAPHRLADMPEADFPRRCLRAGCERYEESEGWSKGVMVAGLWTRGKFVYLDAMINHTDWPLPVTPAGHYAVTMYRTQDGRDVEVRVGAGRFANPERDEEGPYPPGYTENANIVDSIQNLLNYNPAMPPITPRDVVWIVSTGTASDEIAFDDYVDPNAFIVSDMGASIVGGRLTPGGAVVPAPHHRIGLGYLLPLPAFTEDIHIQNAATTLDWSVPPYGLVKPGEGRVEPLAMGGIKGRGFWLTGEGEILYRVPAQNRDIRASDWYVALFVDSRAAGGESRSLIAFPDGTAVRLAPGRVEYARAGEVVHEVAVPAREGWMHLAWRLGDGGRRVTMLVDGYPLDRRDFEAPLFEMAEGKLVLGDAEGDGIRGARGWIDEFKVLAHGPNAEVACNHAHGTLARIEGNARWAEAAAAYPDWAHAEVGAAAGEYGGARYACFHDYSGDWRAHLANLPDGTESVRGRINFPEGPVRAGAPRPDSSANAFCLSCHTEGGKGGLSLRALEARAAPAEFDRRRQPHQPPPRAFGVIPPGWIAPGPGAGSPPEGAVAPPEGLPIDPWILPAAGQ